MIGKEAAERILDQALELSEADQTEAVLIGEDTSLTRFANSAIHQNVNSRNAELRVRAVFGKRVGVASTNDLSVASVRNLIDKAVAIARLQAENPDFVSLPLPEPITTAPSVIERTLTFTPEGRALSVGTICRKAKERRMSAAGTFSTGGIEIAVANSLGIKAYHLGTIAHLTSIVSSDSSSGYAEAASADALAIGVDDIADEAIERAERGRNPVELPPGDYTVVLEEYAASDILDYLAYLGFSALSVQERRSFMAGKLGQRIVGDAVTIWDDGLDSTGLPLPFDFEGVPKRRLALIDRGIARNVVYDSYTALREERQSTGHALPAPNPFGPSPLNLFMSPGSATRDDLIRRTQRGVLVTRFWYTRPVHPLHVIITGMTRDGTFLIENGEVTRPIKNLRFTQSYLQALEGLDSTEDIGNTTRLLRAESGTVRAPVLRIPSWQFTSGSEH